MKRIVIVGAGFAGLAAAKAFEMIGVSRQLPNLFRLSASKLTLDVTIPGTAEQAGRDF
jgi:cation diffusion facilitator CzcD-associated flavoprotein CzcO